MADYYKPTPGNQKIKKTDSVVQRILDKDPGGGQAGHEAALLNGLLAMGYDPALLRTLADADPNRRWLDDAVTRALRAGISEDDINAALTATYRAATGDPQGALKAINRDRASLPPEAVAAYDAFANRQPLPFLEQGQTTPTPVAPAPGAPVSPGAPPPEVTGPPASTHYLQQRGGAEAAPAPGTPTISGQTPGAGAGATTPGAGTGAGTTPAATPLTPAQIKADIQSRYGWGAALMDIPEIAAILNRVGTGPGQINADEANRLWLASDYYRSTSTAQREWHTLLGTNPGDAAQQLEGQFTSLRTKAQAQGIDIPEDRLRQIATVSKQNGWSDQQINAALASEIHYDPNGAKTGTLAALKASQQNQLVPLSDMAMTQWAQAIVSGSKTQADFDAYLKDQAKSLFPSLANYLDTTPGGNVRHYLDPYAQTIGKTLGMNPADIDWMDPKYFRFVNNADPKTGERGVMNIADVQRTIIADPTYNYDQTANGKQQKADLGRTILSQWGFITPQSSNSAGGF